MRLTTFLLVCCLSCTALAETVYQCTSEDGSRWFSDRPCNDQAEPITLPDIGSLPGMERIPPYQKPAEEKPESQPVPRRGLTFGERSRLRQLQIRHEGLQRDLQGGLRTPQEQRRREQQLSEIEREIQALEARQGSGYQGP